jgi:ATP-dependent Clp protease ATP-binding subunit ClpC
MNSEIFEKFTADLKKTLIEAEKIAKERNSEVDTEHQLLSLLNFKDTLAYEILSSFDIASDRIDLIASLIIHKKSVAKDAISADAKKSIQLAVQVASKYHHSTIGPEHLLLALVTGKTFNSYSTIERIGIDPKKIRKQIESIFKGISNSLDKKGGQNPQFIGPDNMLSGDGFDDNAMFGEGQGMPLFQQGAGATKKESALDSFSTNLTKMAKDGKLDPVIGRDMETKRVIQTLSRRMKNNPILIGEPGVGKTSIVEGLAQRIINGQVPSQLQNTEILSIDLGSILAGTMYRGQFESRIKKILAEIEKRGNIILFIDEIHMMVGAGSTEGSIDAANLLKPMLAKGKLRLIGSTTFDEYKKHIEKDAAFERRFQPIKVSQPSREEAEKILLGVKGRYEKFHKVSYEPSAIKAAVELSERYINDRQLPDKAIDLIDEAGAVNNSENLKADNLVTLKKQLDQLLKKKEALIAVEKYEQATKLREQESKLELEIQAVLDKRNSQKELANITEMDIAKLVSDWTGVPVSTMSSLEKKKYLSLDKVLKKFVIGQDNAIDELVKAIKRSRVGISNPNRPIGSFILLGPTGVGKTELAKVLAREIFGHADSLIKIDMSEFMEKHNVSRLVGAPAGYVGYEEGGKLTERVRKNPYSVILFDEIEKAHPEVFNILLQIMEDGTLTDAKGRLIDFKNTIIIMTSNLGTDILKRQGSIGFNRAGTAEKKYEMLKESVMNTVEKSFRPEFINRLDQIIVFYPLEVKTLRKIVDLQIEDLISRLKQQNINLLVDKSVRDWIAEKSFKPEFGARPVRKFIQDNLEPLISDAMLIGEYETENEMKITFDKEHEKLKLS